MKIKCHCLAFIFIYIFINNSISQSNTQLVWINAKTNANASYKLYQSRIINSTALNNTSNTQIATNKYGGRTDAKCDSTGFYYCKKINNRWWLVDPSGCLYINKGVNAIYPGTDTSSVSAFNLKYGTNDVWFDSTRTLIKRYGFESAGCWSKPLSYFTSWPTQLTNPLSYTVNLNWMSYYGASRTTAGTGHTDYPSDCIFVFEDGFRTYCNTKARDLVAYKNDKNLLGYFTDNELPFYKKSLCNFLKLGVMDTANVNYKATLAWLKLNSYTPADSLNTTAQDKFLAYVAKTYASIVYNAIKQYDPNHLVLGSRVHLPEARDNTAFLEAVGPFVDVFTVNYYGVWTPDSNSMNKWSTYTNKPFMVTEFYTKAADTGFANTQGAGWIVANQTDRGYEYQNFTLALLASKNCVGWHWFKYMDDPNLPYANSSNKGILTTKYAPYSLCLNLMGELNKYVYYFVDNLDGEAPPQLTLLTDTSLQNVEDINLFPNPVNMSDKLYIQNLNSKSGLTKVQLFDLNGRMVMNNILINEDINLKFVNLQPGIYLIKILVNDKYSVKKLVIN